MRKIIDMSTVIGVVTGYILAEIMIMLIYWAMPAWIGFIVLVAVFLTLVGYMVYDYKKRSRKIDVKFDKSTDELMLELNEEKEYFRLRFETIRDDLDDYK